MITYYDGSYACNDVSVFNAFDDIMMTYYDGSYACSDATVFNI